MEIALIYLFTMMIPINGLLFLGIRNERIKKQKVLRAALKLYRGGKR